MLGSFKIRLLLVIVIVTLAGISVQANNNSQDIVKPVLQYILKDYGFEDKVTAYIDNLRDSGTGRGTPVSGTAVLQAPCKVIKVERYYGWYWNRKNKKQEFSPGVTARVQENTLVKPVMGGTIIDISDDDEGRKVKVRHNDGMTSSYGGLQEVLVKKGEVIDRQQVLGKSGQTVYLEMENKQGPLNPNSLFQE